MGSIFRNILIATQLVSLLAEHPVLSDFNGLSYDENNRLTTNYLAYLYPSSCQSTIDGLSLAQREIIALNYTLAQEVFGQDLEPNACALTCIEKGIHREHVPYTLPIQRNSNIAAAEVADFIHFQCQKVEIAFVSQVDHDSIIYWVDEKGRRHRNSILHPKEKNTIILQTFLGHRFDIVHPETSELLRAVEVTTYHSINVGVFESPVGKYNNDFTPQIQGTFANEWNRAHRVKRTFTEFGFDKGRLPNDLWASMSAYYYNNRHNAIMEEWEGKGVFVNWWEKDVFMIPMSYQLKKYWQARLKELVEAWSGIPLELTDIYGMRRYEDGARLLTHVDREATHAASLIINVAQSQIRSPWNIEIYDFADRLHEIEMKEGDIVYYESARCLHGRMRPLNGGFYVNLFAHYRPIGDPEWFLKENPADAPVQALDIGACTTNGTKASCEKGDVPYLSRDLEVLHGPSDLFEFWKKVSPKSAAVHSVHQEL